jgi:hypothetical protein
MSYVSSLEGGLEGLELRYSTVVPLPSKQKSLAHKLSKALALASQECTRKAIGSRNPKRSSVHVGLDETSMENINLR